MVRSETTLFLRQDPHKLDVVTEVASDDVQQYLASVYDLGDTPLVTAICPVLLVAHLDSSIFSLLRDVSLL